MQRILPYQYQKSYFQMNKKELAHLYSELSSFASEASSTLSDTDQYRLRILLSSFPSFRFKINSPSLDLQSLLIKSLQILSPRTSNPAPNNPSTTVPNGFAVGSSPAVHGSPSTSSPRSYMSESPVPSPSANTSNAPVPHGSAVGSSPIPNPQSPILNPQSSILNSILPFLPPLLQREAMSIQELYYIPAAQLHQQLMDNVTKSIQIYANHSAKDTLTPQIESSTLGADSTRQHLAENIDKYEQRIRNFWKRIDWYREQKEGRNPDPALLASLEKAAHRLGCSVLEQSCSSNKPLGSYTRTEIEKGLATTASGQSYEELKNARILRNKKLLNRRDRQKTDSHRDTIILAIQELHEWGILIEKGQASTAIHYGYEVPQEWLKPTLSPEEKATRHNESAKKSKQKKTALQRSIKEAQKQEEQSRLDSFFLQDQDEH